MSCLTDKNPISLFEPPVQWVGIGFNNLPETLQRTVEHVFGTLPTTGAEIFFRHASTTTSHDRRLTITGQKTASVRSVILLVTETDKITWIQPVIITESKERLYHTTGIFAIDDANHAMHCGNCHCTIKSNGGYWAGPNYTLSDGTHGWLNITVESVE